MQSIRLRVAYDGFELAGWQRQPAQRTVQGELERAVSEVAGAPIEVRGASRTDAGVHAEGQVAAFDSPRELPLHGWVRALNGKLDPAIAVRDAEPCALGYKPRFDAIAKTYRYLLHLGAVPDPRWRRYAWHLGPRRTKAGQLDLDAMRDAARRLEGEHDFRAFRASGDERENTVRTLTRVAIVAGICERDDLIAVEVRGTAFMQHMIRILVGTLVDVGRGRTRPEEIDALLGPEASRAQAGETAPAWGLTLIEVELGREALAR